MRNTDTPDTAAVFFMEDLYVGQRFTSGSHVVDEVQIKQFASEFDPQPFHLDAAAAKATLFGGLAASGWHTAAITMRLLVQGRTADRRRHHRFGRRIELAQADPSW